MWESTRKARGPRLRASGIEKSYGSTRALVGVDLEIDAGEIVALLGPNGAGKTTLVSIVAGLRRPDAGSVRIDGSGVLRYGHVTGGQLGLAPQETGIYPTVTVRGNLEFFGELAGLHGRALRREVAEVAEAFELTGLLDRRAQSLSGGEARRLHTAMIVVRRPPVLLLDEPTTGVDVHNRNRLLEVIRSLAEKGSAICYSTHYLHEVERLGVARVEILVAGRIAASGSIGELVEAHGEAAVELRFGGTPPQLNGSGRSARVAGNVLRVPCEGPPATAAAAVLGELGRAASDLREIKLIQPSLESVFLTVAGSPPAVGLAA